MQNSALFPSPAGIAHIPQEVSIKGLTFCNLDEMETYGQKVQNIGANLEELKQNCAKMSKILSQNIYCPQKTIWSIQ